MESLDANVGVHCGHEPTLRGRTMKAGLLGQDHLEHFSLGS
jgi:hypothetical protein